MSEQPWLIVGLGNPGAQYAATRHNVGYLVLDLLADRMGAKLGKHKRAHADTAEGRLAGHRAVLLRSRTFMNESGGPIKAAAGYARIPSEQIVLVYDDIDIAFGALRLKIGGGSGGHNGVRSTQQSLGTPEFYRLRVGVGRPPGRQDAADYVLRPFNATERKALGELVDRTADAVEMLIADGLLAAQSKFHGE